MEKQPEYAAPTMSPAQEQQQYQQQQFQEAPPQFQQQQLPQPSMQIYPNPLNLSIDKDGKREFSHSLCSCCDVPSSCLLSWCCPCIMYGQTKQRFAGRIANQHVSEPSVAGSDCCIWYVVSMFTCAFLLDCSLRGDIRKRYNIKGSACNDCCASAYCLPCIQVQHSQEIFEEEQQLIRQMGHQQQ